MGNKGATRNARRRTVIAVVITAVTLLVHAVLQWSGAVAFWQPCFNNGYDSDVCMFQQYEAATPWWAHLSWLWPLEMAMVIAVFVWAGKSGHRAGPAFAALVLVATCNVITDYVITPAFNGGYTSADDAPGHGMFGAAGLALAGCVLVVTLIPSRRKRAPEESRARSSEGHPSAQI